MKRPKRATAAERIKVTFALSPDLVKRVKIAAVELDLNLQDFVTQALEAAVSKRRAK